MKRLFSNKSGFSLAEIIIAIAVFAIMMAMIMQMLQLSIAQRNANYEFAKDLAEQQDQLAANGKDTTKPKTESGDPDIDDTLRLNFVRTKSDGTEEVVFKDAEDSASNKADGLPIDYKIRGTDTSDINNGLNYFIGNFDYDADGVGGSGTEGGSNGAGQAAQYDTRITGTKGIKDIKVSVSKKSSVPGVTLSAGQTAYEMTVNATCKVSTDGGAMQKDDIKYSQLRFYFYSSTEYDIKKVEKTKLKADGTPDLDSEGKPKKEIYYKKMYKKADLADVVPASGNVYNVEKSSDYAVRIGLPLDGSKKDVGLSGDITFYLIFNGDPGLTASSFGEGGGTTYNRAPVYDEKTGNATGKYHVNIYGAKKFEVHDKKEDFK